MRARLAYHELYAWKSTEKTSAMQRFEQDAFVKWVQSLESLAYLFPLQEDSAKELSHLSAERYQLYMHWIGVRLGGGNNAAIDPQTTQKQFNDACDDIHDARSELLEKTQVSLFPFLAKKLN